MKSIFCGLAGFGIGTIIGFLIGKRMERKRQLDAEGDLPEYYKRIEDYRSEEDTEELEEFSDQNVKPEKRTKEIAQEEDEQEPVDYAGMYQSERDESEEDQTEEAWFDDHQENRDREPRCISADSLGDLPSYIEQSTLYYYTYDEVLCDENKDPVDNEEMLVGDCLDKYGFRDNEEQILLIRNYSLDTVYEVVKIEEAWYEEEN